MSDTIPGQAMPRVLKSKVRVGIKRLLPRSLLGRSLLILVLPILLIQLITAYVFFDRHWSKMTSRLAYAVAGEITIVARAIEDGATPDRMQRIVGYAAQNLGLLIGFEPGRKLNTIPIEADKHQVWEYFVARSLAKELRDQLPLPTLISADFEEKWVRIYVEMPEGLLSVTLPQGRLFSSSGYIFLIWMFSVSFLLLIIAILFMRNQIRPIRRLAVAAEWFGRGRDATNFKVEGAHEVRQAGQAFLDMQRRIKRQIEQRIFMLAGVSHDLRTPLTRMKLQLEMMEESPDVKAMKTDIQEMERMIEGYLDFVRGDGDEPTVALSVKAMLDQILSRVKKEFPACQLELKAQEDLVIKGRPLALQRAVMNVVRNAAKYAAIVYLQVEKGENDRVFITVDDNGPGIDSSEYEQVFRPFYRLDSSRNLDTGGVGLGLSIAMDIVHSHGGHIWLETSSMGGLRVVIRLPL